MMLRTVTTLVGCLLCMAAVAEHDGQLEYGRVTLAGYGDVNFLDDKMQGMDDKSTYSTRVVPIFLFQLNDKLHIEAEVEYSFNETGATDTEVEYADLHYFIADTVTITAGKFLVPFAQFGPNLHPSWINRVPAMPAIYGSAGGHGGGGLLPGLMPVLKDVGVSVQKIFKFAGNQKLMMDFYALNGVGAKAHDADADADAGEEPSEHDAGEGGAEQATLATAPAIRFESTNSDNNNDKAFGGRIAYAFLPQLEIGYSYYKSTYDDAERLDFKASALDVNWLGTFYAVRAEYIKTDVDGLVDATGHGEPDALTADIRSFDRNGWYLQGSWQLRQFGKERLNPFELVASYARINKSNEGDRWTYGINYWLSSSTVIKLAYDDTELKDGRSQSRFFTQISFGF